MFGFLSRSNKKHKEDDNNSNNKAKELSPMVPHGLQGTPIASVPYDVLVEKILSLLDERSLGRVMQVSKFFQKGARDNRLWREPVHRLLTQDPKLKENEDYYTFLSRFTSHLIKLKNLFHEHEPKSLSILSLLYEMVQNGLEQPFFVILKKYPAIKVNEFKNKESLDDTLVHAAVGINSTIILNTLIQCHANLNKRCKGFISAGDAGAWMEDCGFSPLESAAFTGAYESIEILLQHNVNVNDDNCWGNTALHYAAQAGHLNCVKLLIEKGASASLDKKNHSKEIPYQLAKEKGHEDCASFLAEEMEKRRIPIPKESKCILQ